LRDRHFGIRASIADRLSMCESYFKHKLFEFEQNRMLGKPDSTWLWALISAPGIRQGRQKKNRHRFPTDRSRAVIRVTLLQLPLG
jgi:hypothetical protein